MGLLSGIKTFFTGAKTIANVADEFVHTSEERTETDQRDLKDARAMQLVSHDSWFDILVDAFCRLIRPGVTLWVCGGFAGWWELPKPNTIDPFYQSVFWIIITFWFGGRAVMKDIPKMIGSIRTLWKG